MGAVQYIDSYRDKLTNDAISARLMACLRDYLGIKTLPWMMAAINKWLLDGFEPEVIEEAITRTASAPYPSWRYLAAIMSRARSVNAYDIHSFLTKRHDYDFPL